MRETIKKICHIILEMLGEVEQYQPPISFPRFAISCYKMGEELRQLGIELAFSRPRDYFYFYTKLENWRVIIREAIEDMPPYALPHIETLEEEMEVSEDVGWDFDCDNSGELARVETAKKYGLNTMASVDGNSPMGYHNFNMFRAEDGWHILEPQNGLIDPDGYEPQEALI